MILAIVAVVVTGATMVDVLRRDEAEVRHLPKPVWAAILVIFPMLGTIVWWTVGHDYRRRDETAAPDPAEALESSRP